MTTFVGVALLMALALGEWGSSVLVSHVKQHHTDPRFHPLNDAMNPEFDTIGRAFVQAYYEQFSSNRDALVSFYQQDSLLTYEGSQTQGLEGIGELYKRLSFGSVQIDFTAIDCQPRVDGCVVVFVLGQLITDDDPVKGFSQIFVLAPTAGGDSWYIQNDIFRLNLHNV